MIEHGAGLSENTRTPSVPAWVTDLPVITGELRIVPVGGGISATMRTDRGDGLCVVSATLPGVTRLASGDFRSAVFGGFNAVMLGLERTTSPHAVRMWSFIPDIHAEMEAGGNRYQLFNVGRYDAFSTWFRDRGPFPQEFPAASAVGHDGDELMIWAIGSAVPGAAIENARQTRSSDYSSAHGTRPPCFSRAMIATLPAGDRLLVSGTASIVGETSVHEDSLRGQLVETLANLRSLVAADSTCGRFRFERPESVRVYFTRAGDAAGLSKMLAAGWLELERTEMVPAAICRRELLLEIEATFAPVS